MECVGRNTDTAIIQFASTEESQRAMDAYAKSPFLINDKLLDMQYISPRRKNLPAAETQTAPATSTTRIMVSGFGSEDNIHSVRTAFERFGEIQSVYVGKHWWGQSLCASECHCPSREGSR